MPGDAIQKEVRSTKITPTVGRNVLFFRAGGDDPKPLGVGLIAGVNEDGTIHVHVFEKGGDTGYHSAMPIFNAGEGKDASLAAWCEWMPYQHKEAAKNAPETSPSKEGNRSIAQGK